MKKYIALLMIFLYSCDSWAEPVVKYIEKNTPAPYSGYLFTPDGERKLRLTDQELNYYKSLNESLTTINKAQEDNLNKFQQKIDLKDKRIDDLENKDPKWLQLAAFVLGAFVTTVLVFGVGHTQK